MSTTVLIAIIGLLIFAGYRLYLANQKEKQITEGFQAVADANGFGFCEYGQKELLEIHEKFALFKDRGFPFIRNELTQTEEPPAFSIFEFKYVIASRSHNTTCHQTVLSFPMGQRSLPEFSLIPQNWIKKAFHTLLNQGSNFSDSSDFSKTFLLTGLNEDQARPLFSTAVRSDLESRKPLAIESDGTRLIIYRPCERYLPFDVPAFLDEGRAIFQLLCS